jgi:hypothetical protein
MLGTDFLVDHRADLWNSFSRKIGAFVFAAKAFEDEVLVQCVLGSIRRFAKAAGESFVHPPEKAEAHA